MARSTEPGLCVSCGVVLEQGASWLPPADGYCDSCVRNLPVISVGSRFEDRMLVGLIAAAGSILVVCVLRLALL